MPLQRKDIKDNIEKITEELFQFLMDIKNAIPREIDKFKIIKHFDTKKCILKSKIESYTDNRVKLSYLEEELLKHIKYKISIFRLKKKYNYDVDFQSILKALQEKNYIHIVDNMCFRTTEEDIIFMSDKEKIYYDDELKEIKSWALGFCSIKFYVDIPFEDECGGFLFKIKFYNIMNRKTFIELNNYNYDKYFERYFLFLLGYLPMSDIEFKKNIKILIISLYLIKTIDDTNLRYTIIPTDIVFREFYSWLYGIEPHLESYLSLWDGEELMTDADIKLEEL